MRFSDNAKLVIKPAFYEFNSVKNSPTECIKALSAFTAARQELNPKIVAAILGFTSAEEMNKAIARRVNFLTATM